MDTNVKIECSKERSVHGVRDTTASASGHRRIKSRQRGDSVTTQASRAIGSMDNRPTTSWSMRINHHPSDNMKSATIIVGGSIDRRERRRRTMTTVLRVGLAVAATAALCVASSAVPIIPGAEAARAGTGTACFLASHHHPSPRRRPPPSHSLASSSPPASTRLAHSPLAQRARRTAGSGSPRTADVSPPRPGLGFPATGGGTGAKRGGGGGSSSTSLNVWWFGGNANAETECDDDKCELVAVRIESPTPNSRRIKGEITVDAPLMDVWAVLTDYDNLATHVPNLVESRRVPGGGGDVGEQGDGRYRCRLFQKGAQKIVGFEFGASVTMDMAENIVVAHGGSSGGDPHYDAALAGTNIVMERNGLHDPNLFPPERSISFKCVESPFFSAFDGEWGVTERIDGSTGRPYSTVRYVVDVKPRGPVPVAALEWRIREDVPTNLRAVKRAAVEVGYAGVMAARNGNGGIYSGLGAALPPSSTPSFQGMGRQQQLQPAVAAVGGNGVIRFDGADTDWDEDETMAVYLNNNDQ